MQKYQPCVNKCSVVTIEKVLSLERTAIEDELPSVFCPIFACICCWPLGIGAVASFLDARDAFKTGDILWLDSSVYYTKIFSATSIVFGCISFLFIITVTAWCFFYS